MNGPSMIGTFTLVVSTIAAWASLLKTQADCIRDALYISSYNYDMFQSYNVDIHFNN